MADIINFPERREYELLCDVCDNGVFTITSLDVQCVACLNKMPISRFLDLFEPEPPRAS